MSNVRGRSSPTHIGALERTVKEDQHTIDNFYQLCDVWRELSGAATEHIYFLLLPLHSVGPLPAEHPGEVGHGDQEDAQAHYADDLYSVRLVRCWWCGCC